jgi:membrane protease YdiL (CAAX protease family)
MVLEHLEVTNKTISQTTSLWSRMSLLYLSAIMLIIAIAWRIIDVFVLGLGSTWLNILPSKLFPLLIIIGIFWKFRKKEIEPVLGISRTLIRSQIVMGIIIALSLYISIEVGGAFLFASFFDSSYDLTLNILFLDYIWYVFLFMCINAILEETLFRGLLQNAFRTFMSSNRAIVLSAAIFGIWHVVWPLASSLEGGSISEAVALVVMTGIFGGLFGVYYDRFSSGKTLTGPIIAHSLLNFLNECFKIGPEQSVEGPDFSFQDPILMALTLVMYILAFATLLFVSWRFRIEHVQASWLHFKNKLSTQFRLREREWEFKSKENDNLMKNVEEVIKNASTY